ncbi:hypothetical protein HanRHA438_Chr13g0592891 [Helianthus annuus]|uniref:Uncharacterized protein n=1 Tax=Helianthus annuus TaxID=4232 RepID=A0A251SU82_HELAN|nr:hypothetical protein HanXRQr2_Chr13g0582181 [Helianthus annuus]KAJ0476430.1 hypothetical protein HanHA300_Chr13g0477311 [Helianthus annuus]KAJ0497257.1 hypothetical protein HanHA89_Chr13g0509421 [Helianthus annuus]KAJ0663266.1 hypothetical protein HanLR1_Chr13g0479371 [Helianthus annuus]KAJ0670776.1 hypothetical protein HanOQP8_Chr13g0478381 [Helianthus annuus]
MKSDSILTFRILNQRNRRLMMRKMINVWYPCRALKLQGIFYYFGLTYWAIGLIIFNSFRLTDFFRGVLVVVQGYPWYKNRKKNYTTDKKLSRSPCYGSVYIKCAPGSMGFLYFLCSISIRTNMQKFLGFSPPRGGGGDGLFPVSDGSKSN